MNVTPEQASKLWCPMGRVGVMGSGATCNHNDMLDTDYSAKCIGPKCMMWRRVDAFDVPMEKAKGHCGLAGAGTPVRSNWP